MSFKLGTLCHLSVLGEFGLSCLSCIASCVVLSDSHVPSCPLQEWEERRRQNIEKMNEEMEKIAEYERNQREGVLEPNPVRNFLDDPRRRGGPLEESERDRREGSRRHGRNWGGSDFERVRSGLEQERQVRAASPFGGPPESCALGWLLWADQGCFLQGLALA